MPVSASASARLSQSVMAHSGYRKKKLIDDPGGNKARLEHAFKRNVFLNPEDIRTIMLRRSKRVYDVELYICDDVMNVQVRPCTHMPEKETAAYMVKLRYICDALRNWGVSHIVRDALEGLDGPVTKAIDIDLCIGSRLEEFELDQT